MKNMSKKIKVDDERIKRLAAALNTNAAFNKDTESVKAKAVDASDGSRLIYIKTSSENATSIKGKVVDDSEIGDGKALIYSGSKDAIVYRRVRGGIGGGGSGTSHVWTLDEWAAYEAMALVVAGLVHVALFTVTMPSNTMSTVLNHATGVVPLAVVCAPVGDINGRCWYDPATLDANNVTIWVSNPPGPNSTFTITVLVYH